MEKIKTLIQGFVDGFGTGCSKEEMIKKVYRNFEHEMDICILNDKYLQIGQNVLSLTRKRSKGVWIVNIVK